MGKAKRQRKKGRKLADPISRNDAKDQEIRKTKILPFLETLKSAEAADRLVAISAVTALAEDTRMRQLMLKGQLLQTVLQQSLSDSSQEVVCEAFGLLRNVCLEEGYDVAVFLFRQDIFTAIEGVVNNVKERIESHATLQKDEKYLTFNLLENIVGLISAMALAAEELFDTVSHRFLQLGPFLLDLIKQGLTADKCIPRRFITAATEFFYILSEGNIDLINVATEYPIDDYINMAPPTAKVYLNGLKYNAYVELKKRKAPLHNNVSKEILQSLVSVITKSDLSVVSNHLKPQIENSDPKTTAEASAKAVEARAVAEAVQVALDLVAAVSETIQVDPSIVYGGAEDQTNEEEDNMEEDVDDEEFIIRGSQTAVEEDEAIEDGINNSPILDYLLETVVPSIIKVLDIAEFTDRGMIALNNACLTLSQRVPISDVLWASTASEIWTNLFQFLEKHAEDISIQANCIGTLAAVVSSLKENANLTINGQDVVSYLINKIPQIKNAFASEPEMANDYICRVIMLLTPVAMVQSRTAVTAQITDFLFSVLSEPVEEPPLVLVEVLNSIFDIFGDKEYSYDQELFVEARRLNFLKSVLPKVRQAVKRIDKTKNRALRTQADQAVLNLARFIDYKQHELNTADK